MDAALLIARLLLAAVFTLAGVAKLSDLKGSRQGHHRLRRAVGARSPPSGCCFPGRAAVPPPSSPPPRLGGGPWGRWRSSRCSSWASPSTWLAAESRSATASGSCTPPRPGGRPSPATESSQPWQASSSGRATKAECRAQRSRLARSALDGPAAGPPGRGPRARPLGRTVVVPGAPAAAERAASGAPGGRGGKRLPEGGSVSAIPERHPRPPRAEGLPVGSAAPEFSLSGLHGETLTLEALRSSGKPVMMLFTDPAAAPATRCCRR